MSNQFPPADGGNQPSDGSQNSGNSQPGQQNPGQQHPDQQNPSQHNPGVNFGDAGNSGASGYSASAGGYQGYQPQSNQQGYNSYGGQQPSSDQGQSGFGQQGQTGQQAQPGHQAQQGYGNFGNQDQSAQAGQSGYGSYGQQPGGHQQGANQPGGNQPSQPTYGASNQYGQDQQGYGAGYGQQPQSGGYNQGTYGAAGQPSGPMGAGPSGGKKQFAPWMWIVIAVVGVLLLGGLIWGAIAIFSGGGSYALNSDEVVDDVEIDYVGDWEDSGYDTYMNDDSSCNYSPVFSTYGFSDVDADDIEGSLEESFEESLESLGDEVDAEQLGTISVSDINGESVEFAVYSVNVEETYGTYSMVVAVHPFSDSGDGLSFSLSCMDEEATQEDLEALIDETEFELILPED
ncbi:MAG: hypothetical protein ACTHXA_05460 [Gulosibacter sp.]|uniref:hypothetical protein n=1 Tax=Gulosibacter sp. TaxID=2817531 RepID=UPI003F91A762